MTFRTANKRSAVGGVNEYLKLFIALLLAVALGVSAGCGVRAAARTRPAASAQRVVVDELCLLRRACALWSLVHARRLRLGVDALWRFGWMATLYLRLLGLHRLRLDVGFEMALGLAVSLRPVGFPQTSRLGVDAR